MHPQRILAVGRILRLEGHAAIHGHTLAGGGLHRRIAARRDREMIGCESCGRRGRRRNRCGLRGRDSLGFRDSRRGKQGER